MNRAGISIAVLLLLAGLGGLMYSQLHPRPAPPAADTAAAVEAEAPHSQPIHEIRSRDTSGSTEYLVRNLIDGPIEVRCMLEDARNVRTDPPLPRRLVVPARGERLLAEMQLLDPMDPNARGAIACAAMVGDPDAHPSQDTRYALPLPAGTKYTLEQGFGGKFSHDDPENHYALDFGVPEGTPVLAARAGVVMQVEESYRAHGTDPRFADRANYVRVLHEDGSMAVYAHLAPASMLRLPGDRVSVGQLVGKSGNTGLSTGPHLHFSVQRNAGMALVSIPFTVEGVDPAAARQ